MTKKMKMLVALVIPAVLAFGGLEMSDAHAGDGKEEVKSSKAKKGKASVKGEVTGPSSQRMTAADCRAAGGTVQTVTYPGGLTVNVCSGIQLGAPPQVE